ncbi:MAG: ATP-binding protein, partial [Eubacteriales bacterium]|nr:ATP-binding protein [Eubacteriales bacterium]
AGISKEDLEHIWERFYKSDKSRGRDKTGTGLGLTIVKSLLNELGQEINVNSVQGRGSEFVFTLDLAFTLDN